MSSFYSLIRPSITRNKILIQGFFYSGGDPNMLENGLTPLEQVFLFFNYDVNFSVEAIKIILEFGGNPNKFGKQPPLISALQHLGETGVDEKIIYDVVNLFLTKNADPNISWAGRTETKYPIMYAIDKNADEIALLLLQKGAKIDLPDAIYGTYIKRAEANKLSKTLSFIKGENTDNVNNHVDSLSEPPKKEIKNKTKEIKEKKEIQISDIVSTRASKICEEKIEVECEYKELWDWFLKNRDAYNWKSGDELSEVGSFASRMASSMLGSYSSSSNSKVYGNNIVEIKVPGADLTIYYIEFKEITSSITEVTISFYYEDYNLPRPDSWDTRSLCQKYLQRFKAQEKQEIIAKRKEAFECINCGKKLNFFEKLFKKTRHKKCVNFKR